MNPQELFNAIGAALGKRVGGPLRCEACGKFGQWALAGCGSIAVTPEPVRATVLGGKIVPLAVVTCKACGNTKTFHLITLGIVPTDADLQVDKLIASAFDAPKDGGSPV